MFFVKLNISQHMEAVNRKLMIIVKILTKNKKGTETDFCDTKGKSCYISKFQLAFLDNFLIMADCN